MSAKCKCKWKCIITFYIYVELTFQFQIFYINLTNHATWIKRWIFSWTCLLKMFKCIHCQISFKLKCGRLLIMSNTVILIKKEEANEGIQIIKMYVFLDWALMVLKGCLTFFLFCNVNVAFITSVYMIF